MPKFKDITRKGWGVPASTHTIHVALHEGNRGFANRWADDIFRLGSLNGEEGKALLKVLETHDKPVDQIDHKLEPPEWYARRHERL